MTMGWQWTRLPAAATVLLACGAVLAGCGGDDEDAGGSGESGGGGGGETKGAKVIDVKAMAGAKGDVTFCLGKDTGGARKAFVKSFNDRFGGEGIRVKMLEFPESADEQRNQFTQRQRAKSTECDVFQADVIWTAEFALQEWLYDLTPYVESRAGDFIPSTLETAHYDGKYWGVPQFTNAGFLYYRTDQVDAAPETWQAVYDEAKAADGIVYQGAAYEGLTVNFLELAFAAGGKVLSVDGESSQLDSRENVAALQLMVDGIEDGAAPKAVTTYMEEQARRTFEAGRATFMRNWPYAYGLGNAEGSRVRGEFAVAPYPQFEGGDRAGVLGGGNMVISLYSRNPGAALKFIDFITGEEMQKQGATDFTDPPVLLSTYDDPAVKDNLPFAAELKQAVEQAEPRPVSPVYPLISKAIYTNVNAALSGSVSPADAIKEAHDEINRALKTF
jgi:multiple sugar transport system substrate-binding protein